MSTDSAAGDEQGPVEVTPDLADRIEARRDELLEKFEIPEEFPEDVLEEAEAMTDDIEADVDAALDERTDLRELTAFTVDPVDAQDFDDAISIQREGNDYRLWVHIADVTHYVHPGTVLWDAAYRRATSVYLPGHTIHMLPPVLAETVCSLVPKEARLAHTVEMEIDGESLSFETVDIYKSVIRSNERLTYTEAEHRLDDDSAPLHEELSTVFDLADRMHEQRKADGSLVLNPRRDRAHTIVEECMLKANKAVTHELMWNRGMEAMYRVHPQPAPEEWDEALREIQELEDVSIPSESLDDPRKAVNATLEAAPERQLGKIQWAVLKVMPRAMYMNDPFGGHHALNFEIYGHFTSPIRRLSDLVNHWIVHTNEIPVDLVEACDHASERQKAAEQCEREYEGALEEFGLDPHAINNRGLEIVEEAD